MKSYIPKQPKQTRSASKPSSTSDSSGTLEQYCQYLDSDRDYVISQALEIAFGKDKGFAAWLAVRSRRMPAEPDAAPAAERENRPQVRPVMADRPERHESAQRFEQRAVGHCALCYRWPFPEENAASAAGSAGRSRTSSTASSTPTSRCSSRTPYIAFSVLLVAGLHLRGPARKHAPALAKLPPYPDPAGRERALSGARRSPSSRSGRSRPKTRAGSTIPERGLYTGIAIFGAIGSGKTSGCMYPFAEQILAYRAGDPETPDRRARSGSQRRLLPQGPQASLKSTGAATDYVEISLDCRLPVQSAPQRPGRLRAGLRHRVAPEQPLWQGQGTVLAAGLHQPRQVHHPAAQGPLRLRDAVRCLRVRDQPGSSGAEDPGRRARCSSREFVLIGIDDFHGATASSKIYPFERDAEASRMKAPSTEELAALSRRAARSPMRSQTESGAAGLRPAWDATTSASSSRPSNAGSITTGSGSNRGCGPRSSKGISVFLSLFDDNPAVKRVFCPPKETYDPVANADGRYGKPLAAVCRTDRSGRRLRAQLSRSSANPGLGQDHRHADEAGFSAGRLEPDSPDGTGTRAALAARCSFSATNTRPSPRSAKTIRAATKSSSRSRARPNASRSSPPRASARCGRPCRGILADAAADLPDQDLPGALG